MIANSGSNTYSGPIFINFGVLQVGNGRRNGNLGSGAITNNGSLVFNRSDTNLLVPNVIRGVGSITNAGTGTVTLSGASAFSGGTTIQRGTLRVLNSAALGIPSSPTIISNGATLDFTNNVNFGIKSITASGAGWAATAPFINSGGNSGFVAANFSQVTMTTNLRLAVPGAWISAPAAPRLRTPACSPLAAGRH